MKMFQIAECLSQTTCIPTLTATELRSSPSRRIVRSLETSLCVKSGRHTVPPSTRQLGLADSLHRASGRANAAGRVQVSPYDRRTEGLDRKSTRLNSSHSQISYAVFCLK